MQDKYYKVEFTDKKGKLQVELILAESSEMAKEKVKLEKEIDKIKSLKELPSADALKEKINYYKRWNTL